MKHFQDENYDALKDYEFGIAHHEENHNKNEYEKPIGVHYEEYPDDWYEGTIHHFQD